MTKLPEKELLRVDDLKEGDMGKIYDECKSFCNDICDFGEKECRIEWTSEIKKFDLSARASRICNEQGIKMIGDLSDKIEIIGDIKGCGKKTLEELEKCFEFAYLAIAKKRERERNNLK